jgi:hypothetical protein
MPIPTGFKFSQFENPALTETKIKFKCLISGRLLFYFRSYTSVTFTSPPLRYFEVSRFRFYFEVSRFRYSWVYCFF